MSQTTDSPRHRTSASGFDLTPPSPEERGRLEATLTPDERRVILQQGTERPFCGGLLNNKEAGVCDVVMFPLGPFVDERYVAEVLPRARSLNVGTVCFKTFGAGKLVGDTSGYNQPLKTRPRGKVSSGGTDDADATLPRLTVAECLHYTLTLDPDVALLGLSYPNEQDAAFAAARTFRPLAADEMADVRRRAIDARRDKGPCWWNPDPHA